MGKRDKGPPKKWTRSPVTTESDITTHVPFTRNDSEYSVASSGGKPVEYCLSAIHPDLSFPTEREALRFAEKLEHSKLTNREMRAFFKAMNPKNPTDYEKQRLAEMLHSKSRTQAEVRRFLIDRQLLKNRLSLKNLLKKPV